ncbi:MAG: class I SAM-dependent methyltransferase [Candidatus Aenigmarchaeota archaeon]|nr:class I SAM-dependent methyltransferase [Candidatus Aenigmarchaeota archaeon]
MTIKVPMHDEVLMPINLGSPLRCPSEDWDKYGISWDTGSEYITLINAGRFQYQLEYGSGDPSQHAIIGKASKRAFGGNDNNQILREATGKMVAAYLDRKKPGKYIVVDIGSGSGLSAEQMIKSLPKDFKGEVEIVLLDVALGPLEEAKKLVEGYGLRCETANLTQDQIQNYMKERQADVLMQVGSIHHDPAIPFDTFYKVLKDGGILVSGDWHPQTWQEPSYVLHMLEGMEWPRKEEGLDNYRKTYGVEDKSLPDDPKDRKAITDIWEFWRQYQGMLAEQGNFGNNSIWPHESHQDSRRYVDKMNRAGFITQNSDDGELAEIRQESGMVEPIHLFYYDSSIIAETSGIKRL